MGAYQNEHFFVAPNVPGYQISKHARQGIVAINLTAEELIPQIHSEIKRHILEDVQRKWIQPYLAQKFAKKVGLNVTYELRPDEKPIIHGLGPSGSGEPFRLTVSLPADISLEPLAVGDGREMTLFESSIFKIETDFNGVTIPFADNPHDVSLQIQRVPDLSYQGKLILRDSNLTLSGVVINAYRDLDTLTVEIHDKYFHLNAEFSQSMASKLSLSFQNCSDAYNGKRLTEFVSTWFNIDAPGLNPPTLVRQL